MSGSLDLLRDQASVSLLLNEALCHAHASRHTAAEHAASEALRIAPDNLDAIDLLARIKARSGKLSTAADLWGEPNAQKGDRTEAFRSAHKLSAFLARWLQRLVVLGCVLFTLSATLAFRAVSGRTRVATPAVARSLGSKSVTDTLRSLSSGEQVEVRTNHGHVSLVPTLALFSRGLEWSASGPETVRRLARMIETRCSGVKIRVVGHVDTIPVRGDSLGNDMLSAKRAIVVRAALVNAGLSPSRPIELGLSGREWQPFNDSGAGSRRNRTATVTFENLPASTCR